MKRFLIALMAVAFVVLAAVPVMAEADAATSGKSPFDGLTIACVGDSITYGSCSGDKPKEDKQFSYKTDENTYPGQLAAMIAGDGKVSISNGGNAVTNVTFESDVCTIYNDGKASTAVQPDPASGKDFAGGAIKVSTIAKSLEREDLDIIVMMLGTNDSKVRGDGKTALWNSTAPERFPVLYTELLKAFMDKDSAPTMYVMTPIPCLPQDYDNRDAYRINDDNMVNEIIPIIREVVQTLQGEGYPISIIEMRQAWIDAGADPSTEEGKAKLGELLTDSVHPNSKGYKLMAETVYNHLLSEAREFNYIVEDADEGAIIPKSEGKFLGNKTFTVKNTRGMLTKDGKPNIGWSTEPNGQGTFYNEGDEIVFDDSLTSLNLYPVWDNASAAASSSTIILIAVAAVVVLGLFGAGIVILKKKN